MKFLYIAGVHAYIFLIKTASYFNAKARLFINGRKNWKRKLAAQIKTNARYIWVHCASLGEFEQGRPLIEAIRQYLPEYRIVLSFFSPSGYEVRKNYNQADLITYLPFDTPGNAKKFLRIVNPEKVFFIKYEYWYFFISEIQKKEIPFYVVSAIFRTDQHFFKKNPWGNWYRQMLFKTTHFFTQDDNSGILLESIGIKNYTVTGDTRFDRVATIARNVKDIPVVDKFKKNQLLLVAGSTWKPDEDLLSAFINHSENIKVIIAPHEISEEGLTRLENLFIKTVRFSRADENTIDTCRVLIIDSIGMLSSLYRYGDMAYIGGGFGAGIHNILEAATFGLPVVFGPNHQKFREAVDLIKAGGAFPISDAGSLKNIFNRLINNSDDRLKASAICKSYVEKNTGATKHIIKKVFNI